jgi:hypothetical protein
LPETSLFECACFDISVLQQGKFLMENSEKLVLAQNKNFNTRAILNKRIERVLNSILIAHLNKF